MKEAAHHQLGLSVAQKGNFLKPFGSTWGYIVFVLCRLPYPLSAVPVSMFRKELSEERSMGLFSTAVPIASSGPIQTTVCCVCLSDERTIGSAECDSGRD